jgi:hypothetical protein
MGTKKKTALRSPGQLKKAKGSIGTGAHSQIGVFLKALPPHLSYGGGPLLSSVKVYTIFWGAGWLQLPQSELIPQVNQFFDYILTSSLMDVLAQYSVPGQVIGHGQSIGSKTITDSEPVGVLGGIFVTDSQIQSAIKGWISTNAIPQANADTLYFVYLPPTIRFSNPFGVQSCKECAYHYFTKDPEIYYAVIGFPDCNECLMDLTQIDALTLFSSHELCEAITDPHPFTGWCDPGVAVGGVPVAEIADMCQPQTSTLNGFMVQNIWSNSDGNCTVAPNMP